MTHQCPNCKRFVLNAVAHTSYEKHIEKVTAECSKCGEVEVTDWEWEDFFSEESEYADYQI